jgi:hypothetical protein
MMYVYAMENWKDVPEWEGLYQVSDLGRVKSIRRHGRILQPIRKRDGYYAVNLTNGQKRKMLAIHRMVLCAFVASIPEKMHGSHLNGDKADNRLCNLAIETPSQNCMRRAEHGTAARNKTNAKIDSSIAAEVRKMRRAGALQREIAERFGVTQSNVSRILSGQTWVT